MNPTESEASTTANATGLRAYPKPPRIGARLSGRMALYGFADLHHERHTAEGVLAQRALWMHHRASQFDAAISAVYAANIAAISQAYGPRANAQAASHDDPPSMPSSGNAVADAARMAALTRAARAERAAQVAAQKEESHRASEYVRLIAIERYNAAAAHRQVSAWANTLVSRYHRARSGLAGMRRRGDSAAIVPYATFETPTHPFETEN